MSPKHQALWGIRAYIAAGMACAALVAVGESVNWGRILPIGDSTVARASTQLGSVGVAVTAFAFLLRYISAEARKRILARSTKILTVTAVLVLLVFIAGEVLMRLIYSNGMSFSSHVGPIVERFERDFKFNRFDGPSRGPEVWGQKAASHVRILFQGDSITWGQGIKDEDLLYTSRLLAKLQFENPEAEAAVLAKPGRELDGHLEQLRKWGAEVDPDIIICQWFINDMEFDKEDRFRRIWRNAFFHSILGKISYLWFLLDYRINIFIKSRAPTYEDYIHEHFAVGTDRWTAFIEMFREWAAEAKHLTPRVVVMLYQAQGRRPCSPIFVVGWWICARKEERIAAVDLSPWVE